MPKLEKFYYRKSKYTENSILEERENLKEQDRILKTWQKWADKLKSLQQKEK